MANLIKTFLIEEHHEAFIVWNFAILKGLMPSTGNTLIHVDEHSDMGVPQFNSSILSLNGDINCIIDFTYQELGIASFIIPAVYKNFFNKVYWIRQKHIKMDPVYKEMFIRSFNQTGKKFFLGEMTSEFRKKSKEIKNDIAGFDYYIQTISQIDNLRKIVLDIDLDYFSCVGNPNIQKEIHVEITKEEYDQFTSNKYHRLNFVGLSKIQAEINSGKFYYVINNFNEIYFSILYVDEKTINARIEEFCNNLKNKFVEPELISICKSYYSGYTPNDQCEFILNTLLNRLSKVYDLDVIVCTERFKSSCGKEKGNLILINQDQGL